MDEIEKVVLEERKRKKPTRAQKAVTGMAVVFVVAWAIVVILVASCFIIGITR